jgi:hypothetical protein
MNFKAIKKKLKEYRKKKKRDIGLDFLEYGSELELELETKRELDLVPDPQLEEEYQLPQLKPPSSYDECRFQLQDLDPKITVAVSSPTRKRYRVTITTTNTFLM